MKKALTLIAACFMVGSLVAQTVISSFPYKQPFNNISSIPGWFPGRLEGNECLDWQFNPEIQCLQVYPVDKATAPNYNKPCDVTMSTPDFVIPEDASNFQISWTDIALSKIDNGPTDGTLFVYMFKNNGQFTLVYSNTVFNNEEFEKNTIFDLMGAFEDHSGKSTDMIVTAGDTISFTFVFHKETTQNGNYYYLFDDFEANYTVCGDFPLRETFDVEAYRLTNSCWSTENWGLELIQNNIAAVSWPDKYKIASSETWLKSEGINVPAGNNNLEMSWFDFYLRDESSKSAWGSYEVYISTNPEENGTKVFEYAFYMEEGWAERTPNKVNIADMNLAGKTVYISFRHYNYNGCGKDALIIDDIILKVEGRDLGINDVHKLDVTLYPNPTRNNVTISGTDVQRVEVKDIAGKTVRRANGNNVSLSGLSNGIYFFHIYGQEGQAIRKVVKY